MTVHAMANKYAAPCVYCGQMVEAGAGIATPTGPPTSSRYVRGRRVVANAWEVKHRPQQWAGSPVSGRWIDGCPKVEVTS